ncbi:MAG: Glutamate--tRNA ligase [Candidatus Heimdallarchaeota archaeon LC_2]|nr:MAG: Glutamate--tRNA ligase [Candidatus Heimdallarchaeota archaeon LC_2]
MSDDLNKFIRIQVLLNAKLFNGNPNEKAILGKLLGKRADLRSQAKEIQSLISEIATDVRSLSLEQISDELLKIAPDAEKSDQQRKKKKAIKRIEQKKELPELKNAVKGKFIVRYAPDPSKYPHLGQGMNFLVNRIYADKYEGKVILRFDDTNPAMVKKKYYVAIKEGLLWLGATWDEEINASDFIDEFYDVTKEWINKLFFYVCKCDGELVKTNREASISCNHRTHSVSKNLKEFDRMLSGEYQVGEAIVRLVGDMTSDNMVMRDPPMLRIVSDQHPMLDKFYPVFPMYDFESAFLEYKMGITHVIRSGEFGTMRQELQSNLISKFGGKVPEFFSFGRFNIQGTPTKGRVIRELVETGIVSGWDDIRLVTLAGIKKRGLHPDTARLIIQEAGLTSKNTQVAWQTVEAKSKELLEPISKRFFFIPNPIRIKVENSPVNEFELPIHPDHPEYGNRKFDITGDFYLSKDDTAKFKEGSLIRLKDLFNIKIKSITSNLITSEYAGDDIKAAKKKLQWITADFIPGNLVVPELLQKSKNEINPESLGQMDGYFESSISIATEDDILQLERVGYAKIKIRNGKITGHIIHKHF